MKRKKQQPQSPKKTTVVEVMAYVRLEPETLKSCRIFKDNPTCVRYRSRAIEAAFNKGERLYIHDYRKESVTAVRQYKNHKRVSTLERCSSPAKVVIRKKDPGGYLINLFPVDQNIPITAVLKEEMITNPFGKGFSISGDPIWWLPGYMDQDEASCIAINELMQTQRSLILEEITDLDNAV